MITRVAADNDGGMHDDRLRPLHQFELEENERLRLAIAAIDDEYQREFVHAKPRPMPIQAGPEPWGGFLDLSLI